MDCKYYLLMCISFLLLNCKPSKNPTKEYTLPYFNTPHFEPVWTKDTRTDGIKHTISTFRFLNQDSLFITNNDYDGKIYVADFFFTTCPGICPAMTENMLVLQNTFKKDSNFMLISHTVTPWVDSVAQLKRYALKNKINSEKWNLVTGDKDLIYSLARKSYFADREIGLQANENDFLHTENFLLVDRTRRIRGVYNGTKDTEIERLIEDINILLVENHYQ